VVTALVRRTKNLVTATDDHRTVYGIKGWPLRLGSGRHTHPFNFYARESDDECRVVVFFEPNKSGANNAYAIVPLLDLLDLLTQQEG
jgi:hypothetical protein